MAVAEETPWPTVVNETPSGIKVEFWHEPHSYRVDGVDVPSVTRITDLLSKDLAWWGMRVGYEAVMGLWEKHLLSFAADGRQLAVVHPVENVWVLATPELVEEQIVLQKLSTSHVVSTAGARGTRAHDALEGWAVTREMPEPQEYPPPEQPYIEAVRGFCEAMDDYWETQGVELCVGSAEHRFAGKYDLRGVCLRDTRVVTRCLRKDGSGVLKGTPEYLVIPAGTSILWDLKTSKRVYPNHVFQLAGYEIASVEDGYPATDWRCVVHASAFGVYEVKRVNLPGEHFLALRRTYDALAAARMALR